MSENIIPPEYRPVVYELPVIKDILSVNTNPEYSTNIAYPKFSYGFQHFLHQSRGKMEVVEKFKGKKKVYFVVHPFERYVDDYKESIGDESVKYFDLKNKPNILSRGFYSMWELLMMYNLVQLDKPNFVSAHLAEGPGSFIQATMFFRDMFGKKGVSKKDKYHAITLHENFKKHIQPIDPEFIKYYKKDKRIDIQKTYPPKMAGGSRKKNDGNLTNPKTIKMFGGQFNKNVDFITADGGFEWKNENTQEQEAWPLILAEIITALKIQAKNGNFVCKFFETFTITTIKLLCVLRSLYKDVKIVKPLMSRDSNSERFLICMGYKGIKSTDIKALEKVLADLFKKKNEGIVKLYPKYTVSHNAHTAITMCNVYIANEQFIRINEISDFINKENYRGMAYNKYKDTQIESSKYWITRFFPDKNDFDKKRKEIQSSVKMLLDKNMNVVNKMDKILE